MGNLVSPRARRRPGDPMHEHDRLPPVLRMWVAHAALPWSAASVRRLWVRALAETGCPLAALDRLDRAEAATLARDRARVWGGTMPGAARPGPARSGRIPVTRGRSRPARGGDTSP